MKILSADFVISAAQQKQFPRDGKRQIAFAGRSNVGKSSLINALLHRKNLVKTSATPGKTQLVNFFVINGSFYFVDLPGYGYARVPQAVTNAWASMIESYLKNASQLAAVVVLLDSRREPDERDAVLFDWLERFSIPFICVLTKADKLNRREADRAVRNISTHFGFSEPLILSSSKSGLGIKELWREIEKKMAPGAIHRSDKPE